MTFGKIDTFQFDGEDNEKYKILLEKREGIKKNSKEYVIGRGDTLSSIAKKFGLNNHKDLIEFNKLLGLDLSKKEDGSQRREGFIHEGELLFIPLDSKKYYSDTSNITQIIKQRELNKAITNTKLEDFRSELEREQREKEENKKLKPRERKAKKEREKKTPLTETQQDLKYLKEILNENVYPNRPVSLGLPHYLSAFGKYQEVTFEPNHARSVLHGVFNGLNFEKIASCSHFVKMVFSQSENLQELPPKYKKFLLTENIDAWNFPVEIKKVGSTQKISLMDNFQESLITSAMPIPAGKQESYRNDILNLGNYLKNEGKIGSLVPIYFTGSDYHEHVRKANAGRNDKHFNTHMAIFVGNKTMNFPASQLISKETNFTDVMLDFLQERVDLVSLGKNSENGRKVLLQGLKKYHGLISVRINGTTINIEEEIKKPEKNQFKVKKDDTIEIGGPMLMDGLHMKNSNDPDKAHHMNARTRFLFEFVATGKFLPTELIEHDPTGPFAKQSFGDYRDKLDYLAIYDLRKGEILEKKIKKIALDVYKYKFDKIKDEPDFEDRKNKLLQHIYAKQIKGLQITGFLQNENTLNRGATDINRGIPFFDIDSIDAAFNEYISSKKQERLKRNAEVSPIKSYLDIQTFPGDTYSSIFARIVEYTKQYNFEKYPNLIKILELNEILKRKFLKRFFEESIKLDNSIKSDDILNGKFKPGIKFVITLEKLEEILKEVSQISYTPNLEEKVKTVDERVIEIVSENSQNKNMLRKSIITESYETENGKWRLPNGTRLYRKRLLEEYSLARIAKRFYTHHDFNEELAINSYGDFQIRIRELKNGYPKEWPTRDQLINSVNILKKKESIDLIDNIKKVNPLIANYINDDLNKVKIIEAILKKDDPTPEDFNKMTDLFIEILKIDDGTNFSIVGKIIGGNLAEYKINIHVQKLIGQLEASGENIEEYLKNPENIEMLEEMAVLTYNQGETRSLLGMSENYLLRVLLKTNLQNKLGIKLNIPKIEIKYYLMGLISTGSLIYGINTYIKHIEDNFLPFLIEAKDKAKTPEDKKIIEILTDFCGKIVNSRPYTDNEKRAIMSKEILNLVGNKELKLILGNYTSYNEKGEIEKISTSLLPSKDELSGNSFRNKFFNHIRKTHD